MDVQKYNACAHKGRLEEFAKLANRLRTDPKNPVNVSLAEIVKNTLSMEMDSFLYELGINPNSDTISNLYAMPDSDVRWLVPEIIRQALELGYRAAPIWPSIVAAEETTAGLEQMMPHLNMSDAAPRRVGVGETIPLGSLSYGSKKFRIYKVGRGIKIPYEVMEYSSLNVVSLFLKDFGIKMGHALDVLAIDTVINGEQVDGSESAPVVGVTTANTKVYADLLRPWIRMSRMGRLPNTIISGEAAALDTLDMDEFKKVSAGTQLANLNLKTPLPTNTNYFVHGNVPTNQEIILDPSSCLIKFNAKPLLVESEKIVSNQTEAFYASMTTGFAKAFRDSALILDKSLAFSGHGFPSYMDVDAAQNVVIE
jgi:hypothetical protein